MAHHHFLSSLLLLACVAAPGAAQAVAPPSTADGGVAIEFDLATRTETVVPVSGLIAPGSFPGSATHGGFAGLTPGGTIDGTILDEPNCRLVVTTASGVTFEASGTIVHPAYVLTTAAAVHDGPGGDWIVAMEIFPALPSEDAGSTSASTIATFPSWLESGSLDDAFGVVRMATPLGISSGWSGFTSLPTDAQLTSPSTSVVGYPTAPCFAGAPEQLHQLTGGFDTAGPDLLTAAAGWPCPAAGFDGAAVRTIGSFQVAGVVSGYSGTASSTTSLTATRVDALLTSYLEQTVFPAISPNDIDLIPQKCRVDGDVIERGASHTVRCWVANVSSVDPDFDVYDYEIIFSDDPDLFDGDDLVLDGYTLGFDFGAPSRVLSVSSVWIPSDLPTGDYWVGYRITTPDANTINNTTFDWSVDTVKVVDSDPYEDLGGALGGALGDPKLVATGWLTPGSSNAVDLDNAPANTTASLFFSLEQSAVPFKGGVIQAFSLPSPFIVLTAPTDALGHLPVPYTMPEDIPAGVPFFVQWVLADPTGPLGFTISNAVRGLTQ